MKEIVGLDQLQCLVRKSRAIHRDLGPHAPGWVLQRFFYCRAPDPLRRPFPERAARGSQNQPCEPIVSSGHALEHRAVLGVYGDDLAASDAGRFGHQLARHDQRFLIGQRDALSRSKRCQRRLQSRGAHDGVDHNVGIGMSRGLDQHLCPGRPAAVVGGARKPGKDWPPFSNLALQLIPIRAGGYRHQPKMLRLTAEHIQRTPTNRSRRAEERDPSRSSKPRGRALGPSRVDQLGGRPRHQITPKRWYSAAAVGRTKYSESNRSRMPPWPGIKLLESLTPASRLNSDSAKSPICPMTDSTPAMTRRRQIGTFTPTRGKIQAPKRGATRSPPITPAVLPDRVFPGLTRGASLGPPNARPPNMAAVSQTQVTTRGKKTSQAPLHERIGCWACRMARRKTGSAPAYATASRVTPATESGRSVGARTASTQVNRVISQRAAR